MQCDKNDAQIKTVLAMDVGGTFIKSALIRDNGMLELPQVPSCSDGNADAIINALRTTIATAGAVDAICITIPGPFDYYCGISLMGHKFAAIKGLEIRSYLPSIPVQFIHDSNAFLLGEAVAGAGRNCRCLGGITLGTGIGAAIVKDGIPLCNPLGSPAEDVSLWEKPFRNGIVEDYVSSRALLRQYPAENVKAIADAAKKGDKKAIKVWHQFGETLGEILTPWAQQHKIEKLIVGGQIAKDMPLFWGGLKCLPVVPTKLGTGAGLYFAMSMLKKKI